MKRLDGYPIFPNGVALGPILCFSGFSKEFLSGIGRNSAPLDSVKSICLEMVGIQFHKEVLSGDGRNSASRDSVKSICQEVADIQFLAVL